MKEVITIGGLTSQTLVGSWYIDSANKTIITFIDESNYFVTQDIDDLGEPLCSDGMETGTYTWDSITGNFSLTNVIDTNGDCGLTSTQGETYTPTSVSIAGNVLTFSDPEGDFALTKVVDSRNAIVGGWYITGEDKTLITFIDDTRYYVAQDIDEIADPDCSDGMEYGTYTYNPVSGDIVITNIIDTTGNCGLTSIEGQVYNNATATVINNELTFTDSEGSFTLDAIR